MHFVWPKRFGGTTELSIPPRIYPTHKHKKNISGDRHRTLANVPGIYLSDMLKLTLSTSPRVHGHSHDKSISRQVTKVKLEAAATRRRLCRAFRIKYRSATTPSARCSHHNLCDCFIYPIARKTSPVQPNGRIIAQHYGHRD